MFALIRAGQFLHGRGKRQQLPDADIMSLDQCAGDFLRGCDPAVGPPVLVGALPFDRCAPAFLYQPRQLHRGTGRGPLAQIAGDSSHLWAPFRVTPLPDPAEYAAMVRRALDMIGRGEVAKVVLSRCLRIDAAIPVDPLQVAAHLARDSNATTFVMTLPAGTGAGALVGATPELLVSRAGRRVTSHPLAGSAPRLPDRAEDQANAQALLHSDKNHREHMLVVEAILDILAPFCTRLGTPDGTALTSTDTMWHLGTRIEGVLRDDAPSALGLAALLHPTPAVGGTPRRAALDAIRAIEPRGRGFYAGAIGWSDAAGDGDWHVTLRCAEISGAQLCLQAGAGIVAGSDPDAEVAETRAKFQAMLKAIGMSPAETFAQIAI